MEASTVDTRMARAGMQVYWLLRAGLVALPVLAGIDKFFDRLVEWQIYLAPDINDLIPGSAQQFMHVVGAIEIVAGLVVAVTPRFGGYLVAAWLAGIIVNLLILGDYYDVALRDFGLLIGALALARLATAFAERREVAYPGTVR